MLTVVVINFSAGSATPASVPELLVGLPQLTGWAEGLADNNCRVIVCQRGPVDEVMERSAVTYRFCRDQLPGRLRTYQIPWRFLSQVAAVCQDEVTRGATVVVHVNGLVFPLATGWLWWRLPPEVTRVVQHHGERPGSNRQRWLQRWGLRRTDGYFFVTREQAHEWMAAGVIPATADIREVMECSSRLRYEPRESARRRTGWTGNPVLLWAGNLNPNKDPLTVLRGVEALATQFPELRLYMAYREAPLLREVCTAIERSPILKSVVTLLGQIPYERMADCFNSADILVQGSAQEGSGIAVLDALACGVIPVVTKIPSFRQLTAEGAVGVGWEIGRPESLVAAIRTVLQDPLPQQSAHARALFEERWTFRAIGNMARAHYLDLQERTGGRRQARRSGANGCA